MVFRKNPFTTCLNRGMLKQKCMLGQYDQKPAPSTQDLFMYYWVYNPRVEARDTAQEEVACLA